MNWKKIKDTYPIAFEIFKAKNYLCWDVIDINYEHNEWWNQNHKNISQIPSEFDLRLCNNKGEIKTYDEEKIYNTRDLYDFFDAQGLNVYIWSNKYTTGQNWEWQIMWYLPENLWKYDEKNNPITIDDGTCLYGDNGEYDTRRQAEEAAFEKAFELLNEKTRL